MSALTSDERMALRHAADGRDLALAALIAGIVLAVAALWWCLWLAIALPIPAVVIVIGWSRWDGAKRELDDTEGHRHA